METTNVGVDENMNRYLRLMCKLKQQVLLLDGQRKGPFMFEELLYLQMHEPMHERAREMLRRQAKELRKRRGG